MAKRSSKATTYFVPPVTVAKVAGGTEYFVPPVVVPLPQSLTKNEKRFVKKVEQLKALNALIASATTEKKRALIRERKTELVREIDPLFALIIDEMDLEML